MVSAAEGPMVVVGLGLMLGTPDHVYPSGAADGVFSVMLQVSPSRNRSAVPVPEVAPAATVTDQFCGACAPQVITPVKVIAAGKPVAGPLFTFFTTVSVLLVACSVLVTLMVSAAEGPIAVVGLGLMLGAPDHVYPVGAAGGVFSAIP